MHTTGDRATAKPDLAATQEAALTPAPQVVARMRDTIGVRLTAAISGVKDARTVESWTRPGAKIPELIRRRLQVAYAAAITLGQRYEAASVASWFTWLADALDDRSPAGVLAATTDDDVEEKGRAVLRAARSHLAE